MANKKIRYEKFSKITVNDKDYTLIDYLGILRKNNGVKKTDISRILKNNDTWYSQIEMGKKDDHRVKYISRNDLINILSIINFGAQNSTELQIYHKMSADYLDNDLKAIPLDIIPRQMPVYEMLHQIEKMTSPDFSEKLINYSLNGLIEAIQTIYDAMDDSYQKQGLSLIINQAKQNLLLHPSSALLFYGLPFSDFFQHPNITNTEQDILTVELTNDLTNLFIKYNELLPTDNTNVIIQSLKDAIRHYEMFQRGTNYIYDF